MHGNLYGPQATNSVALVLMDGYSERQEDEMDFLQAVFPAQEFIDLRLKDPWKVTRERERERERAGEL